MSGSLIVFVSEKPRGRDAKQALALRSRGWKAIALHQLQPNYDPLCFFDEAVQYRDPIDALEIAKDLSPVAFHLHSMMSNEPVIRAFIRHRPGPVIFDVNDTVRASFGERYLQSHPDVAARESDERFCIENADALCCRDLQVRYTIGRGGYRRPQDVIYFPEYCSQPHVIPGRKLSDDSGECHLVHVGIFGIEKRGEADTGYLDIVKLLAAQGVHLHLYVHPFFYRASQAVFEEWAYTVDSSDPNM